MITLQKNTRFVSESQADTPRYHTRAMGVNYLRICDLLLPKAKSSTLQTIYRILPLQLICKQGLMTCQASVIIGLGDPEVDIGLCKHR